MRLFKKISWFQTTRGKKIPRQEEGRKEEERGEVVRRKVVKVLVIVPVTHSGWVEVLLCRKEEICEKEAKNLVLQLDQVAGHVLAVGSSVDVALGGRVGAATAQSDDDVGLLSDLGLDIVGQVVGVVAGEGVAARDGGVGGISGVHQHDVVGVGRVDNGRDIEVGRAAPALEVDLSEHAGYVLLAGLDSVGVANEASSEVDSNGGTGSDGDGVHALDALAGGDVDGAVNVVGRDKGESVLGLSSGGESQSSGDVAEREHVGGVVVGVVVKV